MYEVKLDLNASLEDAKRPTVVVCSSEVHKLPGLISLLKHRSGLAVRFNFKALKNILLLQCGKLLISILGAGGAVRRRDATDLSADGRRQDDDLRLLQRRQQEKGRRELSGKARDISGMTAVRYQCRW